MTFLVSVETCEKSWKEKDNFCYKLFKDETHWYDANKKCKSLGGDLVSILNETEQSLVEDLMVK